jgi:hypothetical protein
MRRAWELAARGPGHQAGAQRAWSISRLLPAGADRGFDQQWTVSRVLFRRAVARPPVRIIHLGDALPRRSSTLTRALAPLPARASRGVRAGERFGRVTLYSAPIRACSRKGLPRRRSPGCRAWALTPRFHPYLCERGRGPPRHRRCNFCCAFPRVTPGRCCRLPHPMEPGLSSRGRFVSAGDPPSTSSAASLAGRPHRGRLAQKRTPLGESGNQYFRSCSHF